MVHDARGARGFEPGPPCWNVSAERAAAKRAVDPGGMARFHRVSCGDTMKSCLSWRQDSIVSLVATRFPSCRISKLKTRCHRLKTCTHRLKTCCHNSHFPSPPLFVMTRFHRVSCGDMIPSCRISTLKTCCHTSRLAAAAVSNPRGRRVATAPREELQRVVEHDPLNELLGMTAGPHGDDEVGNGDRP